MALREFRDREGVEWLAWDVPPAREYSPPRSGAERRLNDTPGYRPERRIVRDRRGRQGSGLEQGWVCFQCEREKRRLAPVPPGWQEMEDEALEAFCRKAAPARPGR